MLADHGRETAGLILGLLAENHHLYMAYSAAAYPSMSPNPFHQHVEAAILGTRHTVNEFLPSIGGLAVAFTDGEQRGRLCIVTAWHGYDSDEPTLMNWSFSGAPPDSCISLEFETVANCWSERLAP